jgi:medium-chain acyl-[acyl-carrier-protein] hydrolase
MIEISEEALVTTIQSRISSAETDMNARLRLGALVNLLIQSAISSADALGFGHEEMHRQNLFWVLSRLSLKIIKPLNWYDVISTRTWPRDVDGLLYHRDFELAGPDSATVALASSSWLALDMRTKRPRQVESIQPELFIHLREKMAIGAPAGKLSPLAGGESLTVQSTYYDIDLNRHVTSTRYIDWMMDTFAVEYNLSHYPKALDINYLKEIMPGELITINKSESGDSCFNFESIIKSSAIPCFRGRIQF